MNNKINKNFLVALLIDEDTEKKLGKYTQGMPGLF